MDPLVDELEEEPDVPEELVLEELVPEELGDEPPLDPPSEDDVVELEEESEDFSALLEDPPEDPFPERESLR
ncbi:hypothetical protein [Kineococcus sp. NPDC059986]|uniref:hypothetical protein n=1 Tax=Kineococcus sp. NPDC059986 TaxID=3155538 RepID=UPI00344E442A